MKNHISNTIYKVISIAILLLGNIAHAGNSVEILNVSYDSTRELYAEYNNYFAKYWKSKTGQDVSIKQSHGGSGKQARSVIDGISADVVTLALAYDIDTISSKTNIIPSNWAKNFPNNSVPYTSTIVLLVRKGNPKNIKDWNDIARKDVEIVMPNPKTSGGARWNYMAIWAFADAKFHGNELQIKSFLRDAFRNVIVYDAGARGSTTTFVNRNIGDVLIAWESDALLLMKHFGKDKFEIITPSISIVAEPPAAILESVAKKRGTFDVSREYIAQLYGVEAQRIFAKNFYRPTNSQIFQQNKSQFVNTKLISVEGFGSWKVLQAKHFDDGGIFDQITKK